MTYGVPRTDARQRRAAPDPGLIRDASPVVLPCPGPLAFDESGQQSESKARADNVLGSRAGRSANSRVDLVVLRIVGSSSIGLRAGRGAAHSGTANDRRWTHRGGARQDVGSVPQNG